MTAQPQAELESRWRALRVGFWLGWLSVAAVLVALALDLPARHRGAVLALTIAAAFGNAVVMAIPWRRWLGAIRGRLLLDVWTAGLIGFVALLVVLAGARADLELLFFLVLPFIATAHTGWRRALWLATAATAFGLVSALAPASLAGGAIALRATLLAAAVLLAFVLARATRQEAAARAEANARAELERTLLAEAHHRVKNSLQTVADLLLLARPRDASARAFDDTAARIRSIAAVHRLLAEARGGTVGADELLRDVASGIDPTLRVEAGRVALEAATAQRLGMVANELIANAVQHGRPPVEIRLLAGHPLVLRVEDAGPGANGTPAGLGLQLVRQVVERGLRGRFSLAPRPGGGTVAEVSFEPDAHPDR